MSQTESLDQAPVFQLKGSMLAITVLELAHNNLEALDRQLAAKVAQAPNFFSNTPLVLALDRVAAGTAHVVVWPDTPPVGVETGLELRRHWHSHCWAVSR